MRKSGKYIACVMVVSLFLICFAASAAADTRGQELAAKRLISLDVIEGYPDGSLGLDANITRAEMAKICLLAKGIAVRHDYRPLTENLFDDVKTDAWYTGWVNAAADRDLIKGDGKGKFRPNDQVTYDEAITLCMRLLGYDGRLGEEWPANYLSKGMELGLTGEINHYYFNSKRAAIRGDVFLILSRALDLPLVTWDEGEEDFGAGDSGRKLSDLTDQISFPTETQYGLLTGVEGSLYKSSVLLLDILNPEGEQKTYRLRDNKEWLIFGENGGYFTAYKEKEWYIPVQYELDAFERISMGSLKLALTPADFTNYNGYNFKNKGAARLESLPVGNHTHIAFDADNNLLVSGTKEYVITKSTIMVKAETDENGNHIDASHVKWDKIKHKNPGKVSAYVIADTYGKAKLVFFYNLYEELAGGLQYGVVITKPYQYQGEWITEINTVRQGVKKYSLADKDTVRVGDIVVFYSYRQDEDDMNDLAEIEEIYAKSGGDFAYKDLYVTVAEDGKKGNYLEVEPTAKGGSTHWYEFDHASLIFDHNGGYRSSMDKSEIKVKDRIVVVHEDGIVKVLVRVNKLFRFR